MTKGNSSFDLDLQYGMDAESRLGNILRLSGDLVEVKSDRMARRTGNVFVEVESRGKPSGIVTTKAQWWVIETDDNVFIVMPTANMWAKVQQAIADRGFIYGGDSNTSKGVLVKVKDLI